MMYFKVQTSEFYFERKDATLIFSNEIKKTTKSSVRIYGFRVKIIN
jgi:hypothetical protein